MSELLVPPAGWRRDAIPHSVLSGIVAALVGDGRALHAPPDPGHARLVHAVLRR